MKKKQQFLPAYRVGDRVISLRERHWWPFSTTIGRSNEKQLLVPIGTQGTVTRTNVLGSESYEVKFDDVFLPLIVCGGTIKQEEQ